MNINIYGYAILHVGSSQTFSNKSRRRVFFLFRIKISIRISILPSFTSCSEHFYAFCINSCKNCSNWKKDIHTLNLIKFYVQLMLPIVFFLSRGFLLYIMFDLELHIPSSFRNKMDNPPPAFLSLQPLRYMQWNFWQ